MTKKELLKLLVMPKSKGGINQIHESGFKKRFPEIYEKLNVFPDSFSFKQKLYHYLNDDTDCLFGTCKKCGSKTKFVNLRIGYLTYCCKSCAQQDFVKMDKEGIKKRVTGFAVNNNRDKARKTCLERYGVENPQQVKDIHEKSVDTKHKLYGDKSEKIAGKIRNTKLERYGDANYNNIAKNKQTCLERYGVENPFQSDVVKNKIKDTLYEKYGVSHQLKSDEVKEKLRQTNCEKYGVPYACMRSEARNYSNDSKPNVGFAELLNENNIIYEREFPIGRFSYDFKVGNVLVEINPTATHNSSFGIFGKDSTDRDYHLNKTNIAKENGYSCVHVWDWDDKDKIISMLKPKMKLYARKLDIKEVSEKECNEFLNAYHLQNTCRGQKLCLGLYKDDLLVQIMTFGKPRYNKNYEWEVLRLCTNCDYIVIGGAERLFKHFIEDIKPKNVISYCDNSKFDGAVYVKLGFKAKSNPKPSKHWYNQKTNQHITDNLLRQRGFDQLFDTNYGKGTSNDELMIQHGFVSVYDCGQFVFTFENK